MPSWTTGRDALIAVATSFVVAATASAAAGSVVPAVAGAVTLIAGGLSAGIVGRLRDGLDGDGCGSVIELALAAGLVAASVAI